MIGSSQKPLNVGRYALGERIAAGGMATVHLGRLVGSAGFARTVAIKRLHPHLCVDPAFTTSFADEARMVARIRHPNVVPTLDVVRTEGELLIVMEYVDGESLSSLVRRTTAKNELIPHPIVVAIVSEMLHGLHCAHEAKGENGQPLEIVHRDVSPQNVLVGADGVARLVDFGIARTASKNRQAETGENDLKGKLAYMAPEQIRREDVTRRTDVFAAGVVLWELLTGKRLFANESEGAVIEKILVGWVQPPSTVTPGVPPALDGICLRALDSDPNNRFQTARELAVALEDALGRALGREVGAWVEKTAGETLEHRRALIAEAEKHAPAPETRASLPAYIRPDGPRPVPPQADEEDDRETVADLRKERTASDRNLAEARERANLRTTSNTHSGRNLAELTRSKPPPPRLAPVPSIPDPDEAETEKRVTYQRDDQEMEATGTAFAEATAPRTNANPRSRADRYLYGALGVAVLLVILVGVGWSQIHPAPAPSFSQEPPPAPTLTAPAVMPSAQQLPGDATVIAPPIASPPDQVPPVTTGAPPAIKKPAPIVRPVKPSKGPCVSKFDPVTGRKSYQGDCD